MYHCNVENFLKNTIKNVYGFCFFLFVYFWKILIMKEEKCLSACLLLLNEVKIKMHLSGNFPDFVFFLNFFKIT